MESRDTYDTTDVDQLPPDHPDLAAHPSPVDHEAHVGGDSDDDLAVLDELPPAEASPADPSQER